MLEMKYKYIGRDYLTSSNNTPNDITQYLLLWSQKERKKKADAWEFSKTEERYQTTDSGSFKNPIEDKLKTTYQIVGN